MPMVCRPAVMLILKKHFAADLLSNRDRRTVRAPSESAASIMDGSFYVVTFIFDNSLRLVNLLL